MLINKRFGAVLGAAGVLLLAGCGGGASTAVSSPAATGTGSSSASGPGTGRGGFRQPGVSGVIASHNGSTATVNSTSGQSSTVSWESSTPIVERQSATAAAIVNGACVSIRSAGNGFGGRGGAGRPSAGASGAPTGVRPSGTRPSGTFTLPSKVTASAVTVQAASACGSSGSATAAGGFGGFSGTVSKRSSGGFALTVTGRGRARGSAASSSSAPSAPKTVAVTTDSSTTYVKEAKGSAASLTAGECMTALGTRSGSTLAARQIIVSQSVNGTCDSGFGGRGAAGTGASNG